MKIKNLFIALFAASTLFACSEDDESPVPTIKEQNLYPYH